MKPGSSGQMLSVSNTSKAVHLLEHINKETLFVKHVRLSRLSSYPYILNTGIITSRTLSNTPQYKKEKLPGRSLIITIPVFIDLFKNHNQCSYEGMVDVGIYCHREGILSEDNALQCVFLMHLHKITSGKGINKGHFRKRKTNWKRERRGLVFHFNFKWYRGRLEKLLLNILMYVSNCHMQSKYNKSTPNNQYELNWTGLPKMTYS